MKILVILWTLLVLSVAVFAADENGDAQTCSAGSSGITGVHRHDGDRTFLVLQKSHVDLLMIPDQPRGIILSLQSAYMDGDKLAVVLDWDFCFRYQLYTLQKDAWTKVKDFQFSALGLTRRSRMVSVQMTDLTHVSLIYNKGGADFGRKKGIVFPDDPRHIFAFTDDGILKNGHSYSFQEDQAGLNLD